MINDYRARIADSGQTDKSVMQSLHLDLVAEPDASPQPIHLGFRSGVNYLRTYLLSLQKIGINHVAINLRFNNTGTETTMKLLADEILPAFTT